MATRRRFIYAMEMLTAVMATIIIMASNDHRDYDDDGR